MDKEQLMQYIEKDATPQKARQIGVILAQMATEAQVKAISKHFQVKYDFDFKSDNQPDMSSQLHDQVEMGNHKAMPQQPTRGRKPTMPVAPDPFDDSDLDILDD